ncbi:hypothetical protein Pmani_017995 [Petrolisthes manimaculis]|uniref:Poly [ADP-ribose] polymerase n=1 Tax=Petrolisthes manimaculis TaxID=1843537 RepID=A0AAE1PMA5_9EUCA|nr:hypothetical protein Pmani_017995 [Petrolisthes manimaculis]
MGVETPSVARRESNGAILVVRVEAASAGRNKESTQSGDTVRMARGRGRGRGRGAAGTRGRGRAASTRTTTKRQIKKEEEEEEEEGSPPAKLQREESTNTQLRRAINEAKETKSDTPKKYKCDKYVTEKHPKAVILEDYTCMLNQTNIGHNNNKFYIIQVNKEGKKYMCFTRWGRVGEDGQFNFSDDNMDGAISSFKKKFKDKTKNDWDKRDNFVAKAGKYTMIEIDEESDEEEDTVDTGGTGGGIIKKELVANFSLPCSLPLRTQIMIKLIFSDDMFVNQMSSMNLDVRKMPLGKLSKVQIARGLEALLDIEEALKQNKPRQTLQELSSKFYTVVPHNFGRSIPPVMDTDSVVQQKKEVMLTLSDIELTQSLQKNQDKDVAIHPVLEKYQMLDCKLELLDKNGTEFKMLKDYSTACSGTRKGPLLDVWKVDRGAEKLRFSAHDDIKHRKLLWHGTSVAVVAAILKAGLRIMPHSGGLVGKGIYFASEHAKSSWYVSAHDEKFEGERNIGFMFLVEVALGKESSILTPDGSLKKAPPGYDSVVARGSSEPDPKKNKKIQLDGKDVIVPLGKPVPQKEWSKSNFDQSEYLVYKESQACIRYILKFSFNQ